MASKSNKLAQLWDKIKPARLLQHTAKPEGAIHKFTPQVHSRLASF